MKEAPSHRLHIQCSREYDRFEFLRFNRDVRNTARLEASMRRHGFIPANAIHVVRLSNGRFCIKRGHHRFFVARKLGIPFYFIETDDELAVFESETTTDPWTPHDYLQGFVREGHPRYVAVDEYVRRTGFPLSLALGLLAGGSSASTGTEFRQGRFAIARINHAEEVADIVAECARYSEVARRAKFVEAVAKCVFLDEFDGERLKKKVRTFPSELKKAVTVEDYLEMIERVYNRQTRERDQVNIAFLAMQASRQRKAKYFPTKGAESTR